MLSDFNAQDPNGRLATKGRPAQMAMWLGAGQQYDMNKRPTIPDLGKYVKEWMSWWIGMQPSGHMGKDSCLVRNKTVLTDGWDGL